MNAGGVALVGACSGWGGRVNCTFESNGCIPYKEGAGRYILCFLN